MSYLTPLMLHKVKTLRRKQAIKATVKAWFCAALVVIAAVCALWLADSLNGSMVLMTRAELEQHDAAIRIATARKAFAAKEVAPAPKACTWRDTFATPIKKHT